MYPAAVSVAWCVLGQWGNVNSNDDAGVALRAEVHEWDEPCFHSFLCMLGGWGAVMSEQHCPSTLLLLSLLLLPYSVNSDESPSQLLSSTDSLFAIYQHPLVLKVSVSGTRSHLARERLELHGEW